ncbi:unnamed protein product [Rotaria sp. Silwood1]|nr:unnamed protein product [Rotaria sp. Silwood1]CAF3713183.1 unnamed protein product [Rotaria sp. Silwood1]CAF3726846.1 unnamed protein product [Rotaria sp. Silwood1]CAF4725313.1 unnamed protein product [Rotaria sp. Silwood1]CAF4812572.1 unnamed protein product [Rotaria sp. Silwood1]
MDSRKKSTTQKESLPSLANFYLLIYNSILTVGWAYILYEIVKQVGSYKSISDLWECRGLWNVIELPLKICQTAAFLEIVHAMLGLVRSNPMIVFVQIFSRVFLVWGVANYIPQAQLSLGIFLAVTAWSITEIIRYSYYTLNLFQAAPQLLTWCRYSFFIVLYPLGATGEILTIIKAMQIIYPEAIRNRYSILLPNKFNFGFDYFYWLMVVLLMYTYFPTMYKHMFKQRAKTLNTSSSKKVQ